MGIDQLRNEIQARWQGLPAAELCMLILDVVESTPFGNLKFVTFTTFANMARRETIDLDVLGAVNILTSSGLAVFDAHAMFVDEANNEHEITLKELNEAKRSGIFIDPNTGERVPDFEKRIFPFFSANSRLEAEIGKQ